MRAPFVVLACVLGACARAGDDQPVAPGDSAVSSDASSGGDVTETGDARGAADALADSIPLDASRQDATDASAEAIFPVDDGAVASCDVPAGTTVTASGSYMSTPDHVVDGDLGTGWNSGGYDGWLRLKFPKAVHFDRIRVAANALPASNEPYTFRVSLGGVEQTNVARAMLVAEGTSWLPTVEIAGGDYDELTIEVGTSASWISISEVVVFESTTTCPTP